MTLKTTVTTAILLVMGWVGTANAAPPQPLPNPDRPAVTPVFKGEATASNNRVCPAMRRLSRMGNRTVGLRVRNLRNGKTVCGLNATKNRALASNTKIFTTVASLGRLGTGSRFVTRLYADGPINKNGVLRGSLYLRGGGDPSLGETDFLNRYLPGAGTDIRRLAVAAKRAGIKRVTGRVFGDDTAFDRLRGVADSGYGTSPWIGPLSGLSINAGYTSASMSRFSSDPAKLAARTLARELRARGIEIRPEIAMRPTPASARPNLIARLRSDDMAWMSRVTNLYSNNFFAEMLLKNLGAKIRGEGTTREGAIVSQRYARKLGSRISQVDGSGLTVSNRASAANVVKLLTRARRLDFGDAFVASLPVAGRDGTLANRMRGSSAEGRCHAKTGTLTGVSALSGYCFNRSGRKFAFSILMNGVYDSSRARLGQDKIAALIARL